MGFAKVSTILSFLRDYKLDPDERTLFDFLVVKQEDFGVSKPFRHSIAQIANETGIKRHKQEKTIEFFVSLGFLTVGTEYYQNNPYKSFFVDFSVLCKTNILSAIIDKDSTTFSEYKEWLGELAKVQRKEQKPLSKTKLKEQQEKQQKAIETINSLHHLLSSVWAQRVQMFNDGRLTDEKPKRRKTAINLPRRKTDMEKLFLLSKYFDAETIENAFLVFSDKVLKKEIKPTNLLGYFLTRDENGWSVFNSLIDEFSTCYVG